MLGLPSCACLQQGCSQCPRPHTKLQLFRTSIASLLPPVVGVSTGVMQNCAGPTSTSASLKPGMTPPSLRREAPTGMLLLRPSGVAPAVATFFRARTPGWGMAASGSSSGPSCRACRCALQGLAALGVCSQQAREDTPGWGLATSASPLEPPAHLPRPQSSLDPLHHCKPMSCRWSPL